MHTGPLPDSAGTFDAPKPTDRHCRDKDCDGAVQVRTWESSDGAYEDLQYRCAKCGKGWWVEGIDS